MRSLFTFAGIFLLFTSLLTGQTDEIELQHGVCDLPPAPYEGYLYIPPSIGLDNSRSATSISINFQPEGEIFGYTCSTWPAEAKDAMNYAANIWSQYINSNQPIVIEACWSTQLIGNTLGTAGPVGIYMYDLENGDTWYPVPLLEHLVDFDFQEVDIQAVFNANRSDFYYGTDGNVPGNKIDFVTVALHELGHGLGFVGGSNLDNGEGGPECNGVDGAGCYGFGYDGNFDPDIYSRQMYAHSDTKLTNIQNPSITVGDLLTGQIQEGIFAGSDQVVSDYGQPAPLYTPTMYVPGSSYSHWNQAIFPNELMKPILRFGQAIHDPGLALSLFKDMGWDVNLDAPLPVEWVKFDLKKKPEGVLLNWETAAEEHSAGFDLQRSKDGKNWETLAFVEGKGMAYSYSYKDKGPYYGLNYYRILQTDFDGQTEASTIETIYFDEAEVEVGIAPNPATNSLIVAYPGISETLPASVYNAQGAIVFEINLIHPRQDIDVSHLAAGTYWLKVGAQPAIPFYKQ